MNKYNIKDLEKMIEYFDLKNKNVLVHSSLITLGILEDISIEKLPDFILDFFESNFKSLFFPTYNYEFPSTKFIDLTKTNSKMGILSNTALKKDYYRSIHPIFSHCGNNKDLIQPKKIENNPFDKDSFFDRLRKKNGKILIFGALPRQASYIIYTEFLNNVKYRYLKPFYGEVISKYGEINDTFYHFAIPRAENIKHKYDYFHKQLIKENKTKTFKLGNKKIYLIDMNMFLDEVTKFLKSNPYGLINKKPKYYYYFYENKDIEKIKGML